MCVFACESVYMYIHVLQIPIALGLYLQFNGLTAVLTVFYRYLDVFRYSNATLSYVEHIYMKKMASVPNFMKLLRP